MLEVSSRSLGGDGQFEFVVRADIAARPEDFYALVDWADERNFKRQLGDSVTPLDEEGRRFRLIIRYMTDLQFDHEVIEADKPSLYAYLCLITPPVAHLQSSQEQYRIESAGDDRCQVTLTILAKFEPGLSEIQTSEVLRNMTVACHNSLAKLKAYAEHGVGTLEAFENVRLMPL